MSDEPAGGVVLLGGGGRLGTLVREVLAATPDLRVVHAPAHSSDRLEDLERDLRARLADDPAELAFEATVAGRGARHARLLLELGLRPVVATSGVTPEELAALDAQARASGLGGLVVPNLSRGMWLLQRFAREAAGHLAPLRIVERHHPAKRDAPSGTALDTARQLAEAGRADVPIHSERLAGVYAEQAVELGSDGETLVVSHAMRDPRAFAPGVRAALRHVRTAVGVASGIGHAFASRPQEP